MKKYVKPELFFEQFELSTHIAACDIDFGTRQEQTSGDPYNCVAYISGVVRVFTKFDICGMTDYNEYCYTPGSDGATLFAS